MSNFTPDFPIVSLVGDELRTTTLAIADGMDVEHKAVIQLVRNYCCDLEEFGLVTFEMAPRPAGQHGGGNIEYALLNEQQSTLIMTYMKNTKIARSFKKRLVKAFFDLAKQPHIDPIAVLNDPAAMRGLLLTYSEKVINLETKVTERDKLISCIQPQADALQRFSLAEGSLCITDAAKTLQLQPKKMFSILQEQKWIYRRVGSDHWIGYQDKLQQQLLEHKTTTVSRTDGSEKISEQVRITPKGLSKLALLLQGGAQ